MTLATNGVEPLFWALNAAILLMPAEGKPMAATVFVQLYWVAVPVKLIAGVKEPLQIAKSPGSLTIGVGLTVIVKLTGVPKHSTLLLR